MATARGPTARSAVSKKTGATTGNHSIRTAVAAPPWLPAVLAWCDLPTVAAAGRVSRGWRAAVTAEAIPGAVWRGLVSPSQRPDAMSAMLGLRRFEVQNPDVIAALQTLKNAQPSPEVHALVSEATSAGLLVNASLPLLNGSRTQQTRALQIMHMINSVKNNQRLTSHVGPADVSALCVWQKFMPIIVSGMLDTTDSPEVVAMMSICINRRLLAPPPLARAEMPVSWWRASLLEPADDDQLLDRIPEEILLDCCGKLIAQLLPRLCAHLANLRAPLTPWLRRSLESLLIGTAPLPRPAVSWIMEVVSCHGWAAVILVILSLLHAVEADLLAIRAAADIDKYLATFPRRAVLQRSTLISQVAALPITLQRVQIMLVAVASSDDTAQETPANGLQAQAAVSEAAAAQFRGALSIDAQPSGLAALRSRAKLQFAHPHQSIRHAAAPIPPPFPRPAPPPPPGSRPAPPPPPSPAIGTPATPTQSGITALVSPGSAGSGMDVSEYASPTAASSSFSSFLDFGPADLSEVLPNLSGKMITDELVQQITDDLSVSPAAKRVKSIFNVARAASSLSRTRQGSTQAPPGAATGKGMPPPPPSSAPPPIDGPSSRSSQLAAVGSPGVAKLSSSVSWRRQGPQSRMAVPVTSQALALWRLQAVVVRRTSVRITRAFDKWKGATISADFRRLSAANAALEKDNRALQSKLQELQASFQVRLEAFKSFEQSVNQELQRTRDQEREKSKAQMQLICTHVAEQASRATAEEITARYHEVLRVISQRYAIKLDPAFFRSIDNSEPNRPPQAQSQAQSKAAVHEDRYAGHEHDYQDDYFDENEHDEDDEYQSGSEGHHHSDSEQDDGGHHMESKQDLDSDEAIRSIAHQLQFTLSAGSSLIQKAPVTAVELTTEEHPDAVWPVPYHSLPESYVATNDPNYLYHSQTGFFFHVSTELYCPPEGFAGKSSADPQFYRYDRRTKKFVEYVDE